MDAIDAGTSEPILLPFLKWAGGKRWLTSKHAHLFPTKFDRYIEPFLGSAAVFFFLQPKSAILADKNSELINVYRQIRRNWRKVQRALRRHQRFHSLDYYYEERDRTHSVRHEAAAQFLYLNRTCWNGLYRVNKQGEFNVPIGTKTAVCLDTDDFAQAARLLRNAKLTVADFEDTLALAQSGDFVFVDPPYVTRHNFNGFVKYNDKIFSWDDQIRLLAAVKRAAKRGAQIVLTNADHQSVRQLYSSTGDHMRISRHSILAADSKNRGSTTELVVSINM